MCSIRRPAEPLFAASQCHICRREGEFDYLVCGSCLKKVAKEIQADRLLENAAFLAAGMPDWWHRRGSLSCELIPPIGQYVIAGIMPLLRQRRDIVVQNGNVSRAPDRRARPQPVNLLSRFMAIKHRATHTVSLADAAANFSPDEISELLDTLPVVFIYSSRPALIFTGSVDFN